MLPLPVQEAITTAVDKRHPGFSAGTIDDIDVLESAVSTYRNEMAKAASATEVTTAFLGTAGSSTFQPYVEAAILAEHPTILGQVAKTVATGILMKLGYDPRDGAHADGYRYCGRPAKDWGNPVIHPDHDGRLTCDTVVGLLLISRQPLI